MRKPSFLLLLGALLAFGYGLVVLFQLRFEAGDNYPEYSTLRSDPLGTRALHDSLASMTPVRRHVRSLARLGEGRDTTLFFLGVPEEGLMFTPDELRHLETFAREGGRVVFALFPAYRKAPPPMPFPPGRAPVGPGGAGTNAPPQPPGASHDEPRRVRLGEAWGFEIEYSTLALGTNRTYQPVVTQRRATDPSLPLEWQVHTAGHFARIGSPWRVVYARPNATNELPVVIERSFGRGAVVLVADSYAFSNEALRQERHTALLAWFIGPNHQLLFDETHLGVRAEPGLAALARQYHLGPFMAAALVLALLFVWKSSVAFLPPLEPEAGVPNSQAVQGLGSASGLTNLLRKHIPPADLMTVCLTQWNVTTAGTVRPSSLRLAAMQEKIDAENALDPRARRPLRLYREFCHILSRRWTPGRGPDRPSLK